MTELYIELIVLVSTLVLSLSFYYTVIPKMKNNMKDHTWEKYFKQVDIYQRRSHWTTLKNFLLKLN